MSFELFPAIDLKDGKVVRLTQGRPEDVVVCGTDPCDAARRFIEQGARWLHVIDLDGALSGVRKNARAVSSIVREASRAGVRVQVGGGLRTLDSVEALLSLGISRAILGSAAIEGDLVAQSIDRFGKARVAVAVDAQGGRVATRGWANITGVKAIDLACRLLRLGVGTIIYTDIATDGMLSGPNFEEIRLMAETGVSIIASGGIASLDDLIGLRGMRGVSGAVLGKALYAGRIPLKEALGLCRWQRG